MTPSFGKRLGQLVVWASVAYAAAVIVVLLLLWRVGESWWMTAVGLYLPRYVFSLPAPLFAAALWRAGSRRALAVPAITLGLVLVPMMGLSIPRPTLRLGRDATTPHLRLLSYNVNSGYGGVENLMAEVDHYAPDVVFMQEIGDVAELTRAMKSRYPTVSVSSQFLTASRYPVLSEIDPEKLPFGGRERSPRYVVLTMQTPLGTIAFYNVHPLSPRAELYHVRGPNGLRHEILSGRFFSGAAGAGVVENAALRELQVESFADEASHETVSTVIAGDTNLPGLSGILRRHLSRFKEGFSQAGWGFGYTFPSYRAAWMRIDRMFASDDLRFTSFRVGTSKASDHYCVVADVERN